LHRVDERAVERAARSSARGRTLPEVREKIEGFETVVDDTPALPAAGAGRRPGPAAISIMAKLERGLVSSV
jgi:hypothetical protein